jgi:two-component system cell cycle sensor histidine kinase/response regulator CckA
MTDGTVMLKSVVKPLVLSSACGNMGLKWQPMDTILVVEDERAIREMLGQGLRKRGYEVLVAEDGDEALRMCSKHPSPIHVLLCDVVTPGLRARELIRIAIGMYPNLKVLLMTGYPDESPFSDEHSEVFQLIRKPFTTSELALRLETIAGAKCA